MIRAAIIDAHHHGAAIVHIRHAHIGRHGKGRMCGGDGVHVEHFAIRRQAAVEIVAIPGSEAFGLVFGGLGGDVGLARDNIGLADPVGAAALGNRLTHGHHARAGRNAVFRIDPAGELFRAGAVRHEQTDTAKRDDATDDSETLARRQAGSSSFSRIRPHAPRPLCERPLLPSCRSRLVWQGSTHLTRNYEKSNPQFHSPSPKRLWE